uniref:GDP/GTP exchange factor Sec2 N-terminal domain-containing protein n=1 Tax=Mycena chlorophos TaxID=658473 RepID=A0ABQ0L473_MYCCL|nr:predicted protein [Mycena chlorophos]
MPCGLCPLFPPDSDTTINEVSAFAAFNVQTVVARSRYRSLSLKACASCPVYRVFFPAMDPDHKDSNFSGILHCAACNVEDVLDNVVDASMSTPRKSVTKPRPAASTTEDPFASSTKLKEAYSQLLEKYEDLDYNYCLLAGERDDLSANVRECHASHNDLLENLEMAFRRQRYLERLVDKAYSEHGQARALVDQHTVTIEDLRATLDCTQQESRAEIAGLETEISRLRAELEQQRLEALSNEPEQLPTAHALANGAAV